MLKTPHLNMRVYYCPRAKYGGNIFSLLVQGGGGGATSGPRSFPNLWSHVSASTTSSDRKFRNHPPDDKTDPAGFSSGKCFTLDESAKYYNTLNEK